MKPKVSFIIPVYNVEKYIERCVRSVMNQDYENTEIILIDDGSPDSSGCMIDSLAAEDSRIHVIHQKNTGVSGARNTGLDASAGEYILFIDGDDYIEPGYASHFVDLIERCDADMALSRCFIHDDRAENASLQKPVDVITGENACEQLYLNKIGVGVCNKIYRRRFLDLHQIRFHTEYWFAEGMTFNIECFCHCEKVAVSMAPLYHITVNSESATRKFNLKSWYCGREAMQYQYGLIKQMSSGVINAWNYHYREYNYSILYLIYRSHEEQTYGEEIRKCVRNLHRNISYPLIVPIGKRSKLKSLFVSFFPKQMAKRDARRQLW